MKYGLVTLEYNANFKDRIAMSRRHRVGYGLPWSVIQTENNDNSIAIVQVSGNDIRKQNKLYDYGNRRHVAHAMINVADAPILYFNVSPNPTSGRVKVRVNSTHDSMEMLEISAMDGRVIHHQTLNLMEGENSCELNFAHISAGIYFNQLNSGDGRRGAKIV